MGYKRNLSPKRKRTNKYNTNNNIFIIWIIGLVYCGLIDTNFGKSPNNDYIYMGIYIIISIVYTYFSKTNS